MQLLLGCNMQSAGEAKEGHPKKYTCRLYPRCSSFWIYYRYHMDTFVVDENNNMYVYPNSIHGAEYTSVKVLAGESDVAIKHGIYRSVSEFILASARRRLDDLR